MVGRRSTRSRTAPPHRRRPARLLAGALLLAGCQSGRPTPLTDPAPAPVTSGSATVPTAAAGPATGIAVPATAFTATVVRVVDGDTAIFSKDGAQVRVRFLGVDTPETVKPDTPVACGGEEASLFTTTALPVGEPVRASYEPGGDQDRYGRDLWDIWLPDGRFLNGALVDGGYARAEQVGKNKLYAPQIAAAVAVAKAAGRGIWGPPCNGDSF